MKKTLQILKGKNIRVTPQRLAVHKVLESNNRHMGAEEIYEEVRKDFPAISLATVYTILDLFKSKNLVRRLSIKPDKSCFDIRQDSHRHLLCRECGRIFDIDIACCPILEKKELDGHLIEELQGCFYGVCKKCRGKKNARNK